MTLRLHLPAGSRDGKPSEKTGRFDRYTSRPVAAARYVAQRGLLQFVIRSLTRVKVVGRSELASLKGAFIVVANHSSHLDAPLVFTTLPRRLARYLAAGAAADYFFDVPWRRGLTALFFNAFPIERGSRRQASAARTLLNRGVPLLVFPEGTRSRTGAIGRFNSGAAVLASRAQVPCVPVAIIGAGLAHPRGSRWPKFGRPRVGVVYGAPVFARAGETPAEYMLRVRSEVMRLHDEHADLVLKRLPVRSGGRA